MTTIQVDTKYLDHLRVSTKVLSYLYQRDWWLISYNSFSNGKFTLTFENGSRILLTRKGGNLIGVFTRAKDAIRKVKSLIKSSEDTITGGKHFNLSNIESEITLTAECAKGAPVVKTVNTLRNPNFNFRGGFKREKVVIVDSSVSADKSKFEG